MKKLIGTVVAAALLATAAFADVSFGAWLRDLYVPVMSDGENMKYGTTNSWGWDARTARIDIRLTSEDGNAGIVMGCYNNMWDGTMSTADDAKLWVKPIEQVKITLGAQDSPSGLRGDFCFGSWNWWRPNNAVSWGEGMTMSGLGHNAASKGLLVEVEPMENLYILAYLQDPEKAFNDAYKQFDKFQAGFKYTIDGIGVAKVQWLNNVVRAGDDMARTGAVEGAFDLTAVENLFVTLGVRFDIFDSKKIPAPTKAEDAKNFQQLKVALGVSYQVMDNCKVYADFSMITLDVPSSVDADPWMSFGIGADYGIADGVTLNVDFRGLMPGDVKVAGVKTSIDPTFSFLLGLTYNCSSNGYIGIAFQGSTNGCGFAGVSADTTKNASNKSLTGSDAFCWAIPIAMSVYF